MKCLQLTICGKVQGVYFRANTQKKAFELGVKGYVKNLSDGSVYVEAEGREDQLEKLVEWCRKGSDKATVTSVKIKEIPVTNYPSFEIRR